MTIRRLDKCTIVAGIGCLRKTYRSAVLCGLFQQQMQYKVAILGCNATGASQAHTVERAGHSTHSAHGTSSCSCTSTTHAISIARAGHFTHMLAQAVTGLDWQAEQRYHNCQ